MGPNPKINLKDKFDDGEMDLSMCDLQEVPVKEIAAYRKVHSLDLSNNHIIKLPKNFATLTNLMKLDLSKNKLKSLPDNFGELTKLKYLDLYKNELEQLPLSFGELKSLKWLDLKDNPLHPAFKEIAGQCLDSKQCQKCATNIISACAKMKQQVDLETETREKQRQKDKLANEAATQKLKHQEKKNKRKEKLKQQEEKQPVVEEKPLIVKTEIKEKTSSKPQKKSSSNFSRYLFLVFIFSVFFFICTSMKLKGTEGIEEKVITVWNYVLTRAPPVVQEFGTKTGKYIAEVHENLGKSLLQLQHNENVIYVSDKIKSYYDSIKSK